MANGAESHRVSAAEVALVNVGRAVGQMWEGRRRKAVAVGGRGRDDAFKTPELSACFFFALS